MDNSNPMENNDITFQVNITLNEDTKAALCELYSEDGNRFAEDKGTNVRQVLFFYKDSLSGHAVVVYQPNNMTVVWSLYVKKEYRRKGVFTEFTRRIRKLVGKDDISILSMNDNPGAEYLAKKYESNIVNADLIMVADSRRCDQGRVSLVETDIYSFCSYFGSIFNIDENAYRLKDDIISGFNSKSLYFFIINDNNTRIGAVCLYFGEDENVELSDFCIEEDYRGQGYGEASLNAISSYISEQGAKKIYLRVDFANKRAYSLYKKYGFEAVRGLYEYRLP